MLNNKKILITGGTGSFGKEFVKFVLQRYKKIKKLIIFSRDELKQYEMRKNYPDEKYPFIRFFIGDIRDYSRLSRAFDDIDIIIHAAALKHVPLAENDPFEFIKTNVYGAQNIIEASLERGIKKVITLSTDKASAPINLYGATKLCSDKLFSAANNIKGKRNITFSTVRYGNVMASRGSVIPLFLNQYKKKELFTITDPRMTRCNISLHEAIQMVLWVTKNAKGGEIFVPKIPSIKILDLIKAIDPKANYKIIGLRPGEKLHEDLITKDESMHTFDLKKYYAIINPAINSLQRYYKGIKKIAPDKSYNSKDNPDYLSISKIKKLIKNINLN